MVSGLEFLIGFAIALPYGSVGEYVTHRLMHMRIIHFGRKHAEHHQSGTGQGWLPEFLKYLISSLPFPWWGFLYSPSAGLGFVAACVLHLAWTAYCHQLQHDRPELVFWMQRPVHHLHHKFGMWRYNFGISTDIWDHFFGTYRIAEWKPDKPPKAYPLTDLLKIRWF